MKWLVLVTLLYFVSPTLSTPPYSLSFYTTRTPSTSSSCPAWGYDDNLPNGPSHWGDLCEEYSACSSGVYQSPINLAASVSTIEGQLDSLQYQYSNTLANVTLINTRYTIEGTNLGTSNTLSFMGLQKYILTEFHFHAPSEHRINEQQLPLEVHYLHTDGEGNYATLAILYNTSAKVEQASWFLQVMALLLPEVPNDNSTAIIPSIDIASQVNTTGGYYHYTGSTTTPPCTANVEWFVMQDIVEVDAHLLSRFTSLLQNSRPVQPLNDRTVYLYVQDVDTNDIDKWVLGIGIAGMASLALLIVLGFSRYLYRLYHAKRYENVQEMAGFLGSTNNETL